MTSPNTLRALLNQPTVEEGFTYAKQVAEQRLGTTVTDHITWTTTDQGDYIGQLAVAGDPTGEHLTLRVEVTKPGAERLEVNVPCTTDPTCRNTYDTAIDTNDLLNVLNGNGTFDSDPICYTHD